MEQIGTRERLLEVAERLFAERGVHGVSLREIGATAGQRNTGAVRYHFGSKEALVDAVFRHRMEPINARRSALLAELDAAGRGTELRDLAEAVLHPLSGMLGDRGHPSWYLRFCVHAAYVEGASPTDLSRQPWTSAIYEVQRRFERALAALGIPAELHRDRWELFTGHLARPLADRELQLQLAPGRVLSDRALFLAGLVDTAVALASAPVSDETTHLLHHRRTA
jgi:AcrR family transcriptional regulator